MGGKLAPNLYPRHRVPLAAPALPRDSLVHAKGGCACNDCLWSAHADDNVKNVVGAGATADVLRRNPHKAGERITQLGLRRVWVDVVIDLGVSRGRRGEHSKGRLGERSRVGWTERSLDTLPL